MPFGSLFSHQPAPFVESQISTSWSGVYIGQGTNWRPGITSISMPFTGDIFVDLWVQTSYPAPATILASSVWPYTPIGPTNYFAGKVTQWNPNGGVFPVPFVARWANIAAGTFFQLTLEIRNDICNGNMGIEQVQGFLRAQAT